MRPAGICLNKKESCKACLFHGDAVSYEIKTGSQPETFRPEDMPVWVRRGARIPLYPEPVSCTDEMDLSKAVSVVVNEAFEGIWKYVK